MAQISSPYGMRPVQIFGGTPFAAAIRSYPVLSNPTNPIFFAEPVAIVAGNIQKIAASPTNATTANSPIGVFLGAEWQDPIRGFVNSQYLPGGLGTTATQVRCKVLEHPWAVFKIQASGPVNNNQLQLNMGLLASSLVPGSANGNVATGDSLIAGDAASIAVTATLALTIVGFPNAPGSQPGDPFTDVLVCWNFGVHRMMNSLAI